jgi:hypothetical protein
MQKEVAVGFAAFIGIDWADRKHDVCLCVAGDDKRERLVLEPHPALIRDAGMGGPGTRAAGSSRHVGRLLSCSQRPLPGGH